MTVAGEKVGIGAAHCADQELVAHRAPVDEKKLQLGVGAIVGRKSGISRDDKTFACHVHLRGIVCEVTTHDLCEPLQAALEEIVLCFQHQRATAIHRQREGDVGPRHRQTFYDIECGQILRTCRLQKFQARRRREEEFADFDARSALPLGAKSGRRQCSDNATVDTDFMRLAARRSTRDRKPRHRTDRWQRLSPEAKCRNRRKIVVLSLARQLRCRMTLDCDGKIVACHALAIVFDHYEIGAAIRRRDLNSVGTRIERVLNQFLDRTRWSFHHLACGDAVDRSLGEPADLHFCSARYWRASTLPSSTPG